ncbi:MAG TPA: ATP-binding protein [Steroidobacteraceae bacterium]|nr:ATP-binding protein [Steroidobacteraceae bacterium]
MVSTVSQPGASSLRPVTMRIADPVDIRIAEDAARRLSASVGFSAGDCEEVALAVTELASNLIRHAGGGTLSLEPTSREARQGIQIESADSGPGFEDFERALTDGFSTLRSLGTGLGAVNRLMDELEYSPGGSAGAHIVCRRWVRQRAASSAAPKLDFGVASRAYRQLHENGDAFVICKWGDKALAGVIDGLGHGQFAQRAAQAARQYVEQHHDQPLEALFRGAGRACQATRGVVMMLVLLDASRQTFTVASVGDIELRVWGGPERLALVPRRGVVGLRAPAPATAEHPFSPRTVLVMHSDGLRSRWDFSDFPWIAHETASVAAQRLLAALARDDDDATVLVVRNMPS